MVFERAKAWAPGVAFGGDMVLVEGRGWEQDVVSGGKGGWAWARVWALGWRWGWGGVSEQGTGSVQDTELALAMASGRHKGFGLGEELEVEGQPTLAMGSVEDGA